MCFYGGPMIGRKATEPMTGHSGAGLLLMLPSWTSPHQPRIEFPVLLLRGTNDRRQRNGRRYPTGFT